MQRKIGGLVTDGSVRDTDQLDNYGLPVFAFSSTAKQGPAVMLPWGGKMKLYPVESTSR